MNEGFKNVGKVTPALKVTQSFWNSDRIPSSRTLTVTLLGGWFPDVWIIDSTMANYNTGNPNSMSLS